MNKNDFQEAPRPEEISSSDAARATYPTRTGDLLITNHGAYQAERSAAGDDSDSDIQLPKWTGQEPEQRPRAAEQDAELSRGVVSRTSGEPQQEPGSHAAARSRIFSRGDELRRSVCMSHHWAPVHDGPELECSFCGESWASPRATQVCSEALKPDDAVRMLGALYDDDRGVRGSLADAIDDAKLVAEDLNSDSRVVISEMLAEFQREDILTKREREAVIVLRLLLDMNTFVQTSTGDGDDRNQSGEPVAMTNVIPFNRPRGGA